MTGNAGFLGRHFTAELHRQGWDVHGCDRRRSELLVLPDDDMRTLLPHTRTVYDLVVHCAAMSPHREAIDSRPVMHPYNVALDAAMFEWAIRTGQKRVLYFSSCAAADGPVDGYAATKLTGEWLAAEARKAGLAVTVVRPYSGYGEDQSEDFPFRAFVERARRREDPFTIWGDGTQVRDWIHVDDLVRGALMTARAGVTEPVSLCTGAGTSMLEVAQMCCAEAGYGPEFEFRLDKPAGVSSRVGDPSMLYEFYRPTVSLALGVKRAFA